MRSSEIYFVCSAILDNKLISKQIQALDFEEASNIFLYENNIEPQSIFGPYKKRRLKFSDKDVFIKFKNPNITKKGIYKNWIITAILLEYPNNYAYVFFDRRIDEKITKKPNNNLISVEELEINNE